MSNDPTESHLPQPNGNLPSDTAAEQAMINRARAALESTPETIGPYRIIEKIGQGGMGEVYRAEQRVPIRRQVAIKLIKLGMDTKQVIARFEAERQALALMDHPHIAKVLDASSDDSGRPFFVMEYVKGIPIHDYADKNQLTIQERLVLFAQVCHAIQHAHHKGVIHRDIKPSNVLTYTQDGKPHAKIIDFGIAKAIAQQLTDQTFYTLHTQFLGTPQYMSPEQAEGNLDIDTRTDVYSLGVMLYELLTGTTPFSLAELKANAVDQIRKIICETEPPKPSTRLTIETATLNAIAAARRVEPTRLGSLVRGELDWIVMMALDKDRRRRYDTPNDLADDIEAYLQGERVKAAPPSRLYLMQKFAKRNKGAVAIASILTTSLGIGLAGTTWQWYRADRNAQTAELSSAEAKVARERAEDALQQAEKEREIAIEQRDNAEFEAYVANLNFANGAVEQGEYREAQEYLKRCPEQHRGWEWRFLNEMTVGNDSFIIPKQDVIALDSTNSCLAVLQGSGRQCTIYSAAKINAPTKFIIPFEHMGSSVNSMGMALHDLALEVSQNKRVFYLSLRKRDLEEVVILRVDIDGDCKELLKHSDGFTSIAVSDSGSRIVVGFPGEGYRVFHVADEIKEELRIPPIDSTHFIGFTCSSDSQLVILEKGIATSYNFSDANSIPTAINLDATQRAGVVASLAPGIIARTNNQMVPDYLDRDEFQCERLSSNNEYCILQGKSGECELWSMLSQELITRIPPTHQMEFSKDSKALWVINEKGEGDVYQLQRVSSNPLLLTRSRLPVDNNFEPLTDRLVQASLHPFLGIYGDIFDISGRQVSHQFGLEGIGNVFIVEDRFVPCSYNVDRDLFVSTVDDICLLPSRGHRKTELAASTVDIIELSRTCIVEENRRITALSHGLRIEDLKRARQLVDIRIAWPSGVRSLHPSNDQKTIYASIVDDYWVRYDTRPRNERLKWYDGVCEQLPRARAIVDSLWEGSTLFHQLDNEIDGLLPVELKEAARQVLEARRFWLISKASDLFDKEKYQYVGRKSDMLIAISELCDEKRMYRDGGPLIELVRSWDGQPRARDFRYLKDALLQNSLNTSLRENLADVVQAYRLADSKMRFPLVAVVGFLRLEDYETASSILLPLVDEGAFSEKSDFTISLCCSAMLAIHDGRLERASKFLEEAESSRSKEIAKGRLGRWNTAEQKFFEETQSRLEVFRESGAK